LETQKTNLHIIEQADSEFNSQKSIRAVPVLDANAVSVGQTGIISEPSADNNGSVVFMTGNTWAARSTDGGTNFSFVDPFSDFTLLCCDQDVIYNEKHDVWVWYRQGFGDPSLGGSGFKNNVKINVSTDDALTWCTYTLTASDIDAGLTDHFVDYPHLQATDDKLYVSTNIFDNVESDVFTAKLRFDLADLSTCDPVTFQIFLSSTEFNFTPVNGASDTMYFATQLSETQTKIYSWPDASLDLDSSTVNYTAYPFLGYSCIITSTGTNPCGRSDTRVMGGYLSNGVLGFVWDAAQGGNFTFPYVNFITVDESLGTLLSNNPFFSPSVATNFASFGVTDAGDVGIGLFQMGGATNPTYLVGIDDSQTGINEFDFATVKTSSHGPGTTNQWGDYIRIKPFQPDNGQWIGTGFTMQGGTTNSDVENLFVTFGRIPFCSPPISGDWIITASCIISSSPSNPTINNGDLVVQNNSVLTIASGVSLDIDFTLHNLTVASGSGILIKSGGAIT